MMITELVLANETSESYSIFNQIQQCLFLGPTPSRQTSFFFLQVWWSEMLVGFSTMQWKPWPKSTLVDKYQSLIMVGSTYIIDPIVSTFSFLKIQSPSLLNFLNFAHHPSVSGSGSVALCPDNIINHWDMFHLAYLAFLGSVFRLAPTTSTSILMRK